MCNDGRQPGLQVAEALGGRGAVVLLGKLVGPGLLCCLAAVDVVHFVDAEVAFNEFDLVHVLRAVLYDEAPVTCS